MRRFQDSLLIGVFVALALTALSVLAGGGPGVSGPIRTLTGTTTLTTGQLLVPDGMVGAPGYAFSSDTDTGLLLSGAWLLFSHGNSNRFGIGSAAQIRTQAAGTYGWVPGTDVTAAADVILSRAAANRLALATGDSLEAESHRDITLDAVCATPPADHVNYCTHDGSNFTGTATNDCARVGVLDDGTEVLIQVLRTDAPC